MLDYNQKYTFRTPIFAQKGNLTQGPQTSQYFNHKRTRGENCRLWAWKDLLTSSWYYVSINLNLMVSGAITFTWNQILWRRRWFLVGWLHILRVSWRKTSFSVWLWNRSTIWDFQGLRDTKKKWLAWNFGYGRLQTNFPKVRSKPSSIQEIVSLRSTMVIPPHKSKPIKKIYHH